MGGIIDTPCMCLKIYISVCLSLFLSLHMHEIPTVLMVEDSYIQGNQGPFVYRQGTLSNN